MKPQRRPGVPVWGYSYRKAGWEVLPQRTKRGLLRLEKTFLPLGWLDTWATGTTGTTQAWPFPERFCQRDPCAGAQPPWRPDRRPIQRHKITLQPGALQMSMFG